MALLGSEVELLRNTGRPAVLDARQNYVLIRTGVIGVSTPAVPAYCPCSPGLYIGFEESQLQASLSVTPGCAELWVGSYRPAFLMRDADHTGTSAEARMYGTQYCTYRRTWYGAVSQQDLPVQYYCRTRCPAINSYVHIY